MRPVHLVTASLVVLTFTAALAADAGDTNKRRVLVADAVGNGVDAALPKTLTSMLVTRLDARPGIDALSGAELRQLMSLQADKAACGSDDCVNDLTGALGAPLALFSDVGKLGTLTEVNLTLFDVVKGEPVARASAEAEKLEDLPKKLDDAVATLLAKAPKTEVVAAATPPAKTSTPMPTPTPTPTPTVEPAAGLGLRGTGQGGGGVGEGTIGLGSLGTIGHGAGPGRLEPADIRAVVDLNRKSLKECAELAHKKKVAGVVKVRFLIAPDGKVTFANVAGGDLGGSGVPKCIIDKVASWTFRSSPEPTSIVYPIQVR